MDRLNVYFGHSKDIDYKLFYEKIENYFDLNKYNFIFPHKKSAFSRNGRQFYKKENIDIFIAEVSMPATGLGIELGFAFDENIPVYCFYKNGCYPSRSLNTVTENIIEYIGMSDFFEKLQKVLEK